MNTFLQLALFLVVLLALAKPLGAYMANVYEGKRTFMSPVLGWLERLVYRVAGVKPEDDMDWKRYLSATLWFNLLGFVAVYGLQRLQDILPLNPQKMGAVSPDSSFNTAVSFATNTNWQGYGGESTMSYLTQMLGLNVQNFLSAATGMAVLIALTRGFARRQASGIGNFWVDLDPFDGLCPAAALHPARLRARHAGRGADLPAVQDRRPGAGAPGVRATEERPGRQAAHGQGRQAGDGEGHDPGADAAARAGRLADRDQAARHQRRWLLQRQLGAPVREPDAALQLPRGAGDPRDLGRALLHLRAHDRRHAPGLGAARCDDGRLRRVPRGLRPLGAGGQSDPRQSRRRAAARQHGRQGSALRRRPTRRSGRPPPPPPRTAR